MLEPSSIQPPLNVGSGKEDTLPGQSNRVPYLHIAPASGWNPINLQEIWRFRDLLLVLAGRDLKLRYRQTALGVFWIILQPLLGAGVLSFVFNTIAGLPTDKVSPFVFSFAGMLAFTVFSGVLGKASGALVANAQMISKVFFPRLILPFSTTLTSLLDFVVGMGMTVLLLLLSHITPGWGLLLLPVWVLIIAVLALGVGLLLGALMVTYRDVQYVLPLMVSLLTFGSPISYPISFVMSKLPVWLHPVYFLLNPLASLLGAFRWSLLGRGDVNWGYVAYATVFSVVIFVLGAFSFKAMEARFVDVI